VILLDAPAEVLFARKGEGTIESLEQMRQDLHALAPHVPRFHVVDATQPIEAVTDAVIAAIMAVVQDAPLPAGGVVGAAGSTGAAPAEIRTDAA
jgi:thymidylate kinase